MLDFKIRDARFNLVRVEWEIIHSFSPKQEGLSSIVSSEAKDLDS